ncbi:c-type cytochrome [Sphingomonas sp. H160509]|uniref:c-type cytochrome n=1 Tax=Sphingomonas sp. H160509 TaxID=2955313 RepID=UPI003158EE65
MKGGRNGIGPNLYGVVGRAAAATPGFNYSAAMKASKLRWDEQTLNEYLAAPPEEGAGHADADRDARCRQARGDHRVPEGGGREVIAPRT